MILKEEFLRRFSRDLLEGAAALFIGAGMSVPVGFVNWKELLREIATDLGLNIDQENDLIAVAQYEWNRTNSRDALDEAIVRQFNREAKITESHRLIARLPIDTVWTTNYDKLLELAFADAKRRTDVKHAVAQIRTRNPYADVTIYKMHGDVDHAADAILTKDDYECYEIERQAFTVQLLSDLISKRFLFLGFSFTDPNIEYTFNRLRRMVNPSHRRDVGTREHYCILKRPALADYSNFKGTSGEMERACEIDQNRFAHRVRDLTNYGIQTIAIENYKEIEELLAQLSRRVRCRVVMISGAAETMDPMGERLSQFCRLLGRTLIEKGYDIVSGVGNGISGPLMIGAQEALSRPGVGRIGERIRLFPFPYWLPDDQDKAKYYEANRSELVRQAGITIVISGNKLDPKSGAIIPSPGVLTEVEMARSAGHLIFPVGATGHRARELWYEVKDNLDDWYPRIKVDTELEKLGNGALTPEEHVGAVLALLERIQTQ